MNFEDELRTTRVRSEKLGIKSGITQEEFNQIVVTHLESLQKHLYSAQKSTISSAMDITTDVGKNIAKTLVFEPSAADVKLNPKEAAIELTYDITETLKSIPKEGNIRKTSILVKGNRTVIANTDKPKQVLQIPPNEFPILVDISIKGDTSEGGFIISASKNFTVNQAHGILHFTKELSESRPIETQEDLNIKLLQEIEYLKRLIK